MFVLSPCGFVCFPGRHHVGKVQATCRHENISMYGHGFGKGVVAQCVYSFGVGLKRVGKIGFGKCFACL